MRGVVAAATPPRRGRGQGWTFIAALLALGTWLTPVPSRASMPALVEEAIWSPALSEWRRVTVRVPDSYATSRQRYPVLYLLDGDDHEYHASGVAAFLAENQLMPEVIVVAIPNGAGHAKRDRDLTPDSRVAEEARLGGGADRFLGFVRDDLAAWVEQRFRTVQFRILVGHSYGGLFALHTLVERPDAFDAYLALDPSLWYDRKSLLTRLPSALRRLDGNRFRYLFTAGTPVNADLRQLQALLDADPGSKLVQRSRPPQVGEDHNGMVHLALYDGLKQLFDGWHHGAALARAQREGSDPLEALNGHYAALRDRYGFEVAPSMKAFIRAAYTQLPLPGEQHAANPVRAVQILRVMHDTYPEGVRHLANALAADGRRAEAAQLLKDGMDYYGARSRDAQQFMKLDDELKRLRQATTGASNEE